MCFIHVQIKSAKPFELFKLMFFLFSFVKINLEASNFLFSSKSNQLLNLLDLPMLLKEIHLVLISIYDKNDYFFGLPFYSYLLYH